MKEYKKKTVSVTMSNLSPPDYAYEYYKYSYLFPFQHDSITFNLVNAWWLVEASALAYAEEQLATICFNSAGLNNVRHFGANNARCCVAHNDQNIILAFNGAARNTKHRPEQYAKSLMDIQSHPDRKMVPSHVVGRVHQGFLRQLDEIWKEVLVYLQKIHQDVRTVWMTGHGIGGALATLAANRYGKVQGLYTFGSPMVGDLEFKNNFLVNTYRFVNQNDILPQLFHTDRYHHVGELKQIRPDGKICERILSADTDTDAFYPPNKPCFGLLDQLKLTVFKRVPKYLKNHVPTAYAVQIWNSLLDQASTTFESGTVYGLSGQHSDRLHR